MGMKCRFKGALIGAVMWLMALVGPSVAQGAPVCLPSDQVYAQLARDFHEARRFTGLREDGTLIEIWVSALSGSWTLLLTTPQRVSCLVLVGQSGDVGTAVSGHR